MSASSRPQFRCSTCRSTLANPRNLAVFVDGTSNKPGPKRTNVFKLCEVMFEGQGLELEQHKFYLEGIGADELDDSIYNGFDAISAINVDKNVKRAYRWLMETHQEGDQIYLFGFSRGAYQVRALAAMIHEVGLLKKNENRIEQAYLCYRSIEPNNPKTSEWAVEFKKNFCRPGVRVHFIGVWDTVSSLGLLIKQDVHITASASVTNACHFRHALALDERRVKFMPEYFVEVNAHHSNIRSPRAAVSDVKEVWFAGCHSDVGGTSRLHSEVLPNPLCDEDVINPVHVGNVPLVWMGQEAIAEGLVFESMRLSWNPEDVDLGRKDSMRWYWGFLEVLPVRHQVSFSGTGKHEWRKHGFSSRSIIPGQQIHPSTFFANAYTPRATLACRVEIPVVSRESSDEPGLTELMDERVTTSALTSLLGDRQETLRSLGRLLFLLSLRLDKGQTGTISTPGWLEESIHELSGLDKFALTVIYDVISNSPTSQEVVQDSRNILCTILLSPDCPDFSRALYILRFSARHRTLRQRFIAHDEVINALMYALERVPKSYSKDLFPLIVDSICYLIDDEQHRNNVIEQLFANGTEARKTRLLLTLETSESSHLMASLKMIASVAQHDPDRCRELRGGIINLATKGSSVGSAAVEALVQLENLQKSPYNIHFSSVLGYLASSLPQLDAEIGSASSREIVDLPPVLRVKGSGKLDEKIMRKLVMTTRSWNANQRTLGTLTLLKLCNNKDVRNYCSQKKVVDLFTEQRSVLDIFMEQMKIKETSLLAAYAVKTCLKYADMWKPDDYGRAVQSVVDMVEKGWFDDAVGRVEGAKIFEGLMESGNLWSRINKRDLAAKLVRKLETDDHHEARMSLICLEILWKKNPMDLKRDVTESLELLKDPDVRNQKRGIKTLSSLAQTEAGEQAIESHVVDIAKMLLPSNGTSPPRHQLFAVSAALHGLCRNETLREKILQSREFTEFRRLRQYGSLYPKSTATL